jgi:FKBP-type peptidyl-prolyl cis-trans isomerase
MPIPGSVGRKLLHVSFFVVACYVAYQIGYFQGVSHAPDIFEGIDNEVSIQDFSTPDAGDVAESGSTVTVEYVGVVQGGAEFERRIVTFVLGNPGPVVGLQMGIRGMREGGERAVTVPPELAYGEKEVTDEVGTIIIPSNSSLRYTVKVVKVENK